MFVMLELIVRYTGDIKRLANEIGFLAEELLGGYAIVRIQRELAPQALFSNVPNPFHLSL